MLAQCQPFCIVDIVSQQDLNGSPTVTKPREEPLTKQAQALWTEHLEAGDWAIDATVGNGRDTVVLADLVKREGRVFGFDIQQQALETARQALALKGLGEGVELILAGHERMVEFLPAVAAGRIALVAFNFGYLPGGDKGIVTRRETTVAALNAALGLLRPGGLISAMCYRGHEEGALETAAIESWANEIAEREGTSVAWRDAPANRVAAPRLLTVRVG